MSIIGGNFRGHQYRIKEEGNRFHASVDGKSVGTYRQIYKAKLAIRQEIDSFFRNQPNKTIGGLTMAKKQKNNPNQLSLPTEIEVTGALLTIAKALGKDPTQLFTPMFAPRAQVLEVKAEPVQIKAFKKRKVAKISAAERARRNKQLAKARDRYFKENRFGKFAKAK